MKGHWVNGIEGREEENRPNNHNTRKENHTRWRGRKEEWPEMGREDKKRERKGKTL